MSAASHDVPFTRIGFTVYQGRTDKLKPDLNRLEEIGADAVELSLTPLECVIGGRLVRERLSAIKKVMASTPLKVTVHAPLSLSLGDRVRAPRHMAVATATLEVCGTLGADRLVIHPGWEAFDGFENIRAEVMALERDQLHRLAEIARTFGVIIGLENMPVTPDVIARRRITHGLDPLAILEQVQHINHPHLRATLDVSHAYISCRHFHWDLAQRLKPLAPWVAHVHLHDSFGEPPAWVGLYPGEDAVFGQGDLHLPLGWGDLPWHDLFALLPLGHGFTATLETGLNWRDTSVAADSLKRAREICAMVPRQA